VFRLPLKAQFLSNKEFTAAIQSWSPRGRGFGGFAARPDSYVLGLQGQFLAVCM